MKKLLSFILSISLLGCFATPYVSAADAITFQAEQGTTIDDDSVNAPIVNDSTVQIWEKSSLECIVTVPEAGTYEINANLSTEVKYITDGNTTTVDVYCNDELVNEGMSVSGTASGDYTTFSDNNLGFVNLEPGENTLKFTIPNSWGARNIIFDYFTLTPASLVECPYHIEAEAFGAYHYTKGTERTFTDVSQIDAADRLNDGTGDGVGGYTSIMIRPGAYITYSLAVGESGYYRLAICGVAQGNATGYTSTWCDKRLVPNIRVNGEDQYDVASSYQKKTHTIRATGTGEVSTNGWGQYIENESITVYLKKGGNSFTFGFVSGYRNPYNNQPFKMDYVNFEYIGTEPDPNDKINIQDLSSTDATTFSGGLYDTDNSSYTTKNVNFEPSGDFLTLRPGSKLVYNVRSEGGDYRLDSFTRYASDASVSVSVDVNDGGNMPVSLTRTADSWSSGGDTLKWGVVELKEGINVITITVDSSIMFSSLTFTPTEDEVANPIWSPSKANFLDSYDYYVDSTFDAEKSTGIVRGPGFEYASSGGVIMRRRDYYRMKFTVPTTATYMLQIHGVMADRAYAPFYYILDGGKEVTGLKLYKNGSSWDNYNLADLAELDLTAGEHTIEFGIEVRDTNYGVYADYLQFSNISTFDMIGTRANGRLLEGSDKVFRGTDSIQIFFNGAIDESTVDASHVALKDSSGASLDTAFSVNNNIINVLLGNSLSYDETYTLSVDGISNTTKGQMNPIDDIEFKVAGEGATDSGRDTVSSAALDVNYEAFTVTGTVISSQKKPISGRKVFVKVLNPSSVAIAEGVSGESKANGEYTITYTLPNDSPEGKYTVEVTDEYCTTPASASGVYFAKSTESAFLSAIKASTSADEVGGILSTYEASLGYNLTNDLADLNDKDAFYADFIGRAYSNYAAFMSDYNLFRYAEAIREKLDNTELEPLLYNEAACEVLGISYNNISLIISNRNEFIAQLIRSRQISDVHDYVANLKTLVNTYLAKEYSLSELNFKASSQSLTIGRGVTLSTALTTTATRIVGGTVTITDAKGVFSKSTLKPTANVTTTEEDGVYTFTFKPSSATSFSDAGTITSTATTAGSYPVTLSGELTYEVADGAYVTVPITSKDLTITISKATTTGGGGGGGGGGGTSYAGSSSTTKTDTTKTSDQTLELWLISPFALKDSTKVLEWIEVLIK